MASVQILGLFGLFVLAVFVIFLFGARVLTKAGQRGQKMELEQIDKLVASGFLFDDHPSESALDNFATFLPPTLFGTRQKSLNYILTGSYRSRQWKIADYSYAISASRVAPSIIHHLIFRTKLVSHAEATPTKRTAKLNMPVMVMGQELSGSELRHTVYYQGIFNYLDDISDVADQIESVKQP